MFLNSVDELVVSSSKFGITLVLALLHNRNDVRIFMVLEYITVFGGLYEKLVEIRQNVKTQKTGIGRYIVPLTIPTERSCQSYFINYFTTYFSLIQVILCRFPRE